MTKDIDRCTSCLRDIASFEYLNFVYIVTLATIPDQSTFLHLLQPFVVIFSVFRMMTNFVIFL